MLFVLCYLKSTEEETGSCFTETPLYSHTQRELLFEWTVVHSTSFICFQTEFTFLLLPFINTFAIVDVIVRILYKTPSDSFTDFNTVNFK